MAHTLSNMIQDAVSEMGREYYRTVFATGGTTTALTDTKLNLGSTMYDDGDMSLIRGTVIVQRTTDAAAPQGEFNRISAYDESLSTITVDTAYTAAIGAGDTCMLVHSELTLDELINHANNALTNIGDIVLIDTSITIAASQTEYTLPVVLKDGRPIRVQLQGTTTDADDNQWEEITDYYITPATPGSTGLITFMRQLPIGHAIKIWYMGAHPTVSAFDDDISDTIHPSLAKWAMVVQMRRWLGVTDGMEQQLMNEALQNYNNARVSHPIWSPPKRPRWFTAYNYDEPDGVPDPIS